MQLKGKKLTTFISVVLLLCTATIGSAQTEKLTIKMNDVTIKAVLDEIESNTEYAFFYNNTEINDTKLVSVDVKNQTIPQILSQIIPNVNCQFDKKKIILSIVIPKENPSEQTKGTFTVKGHISDEMGEPMVGAAAFIEMDGKTYGTIADVDGNYSIDLLSTDKSIFTYPKFDNSKDGCMTYSGYYTRKYAEISTSYYVGHDDNDIVMFRLGEVLLNYAEAHFMKGDLTQEDLDKSINLLRDRVGMVHLTFDNIPAGSDMLSEIRRERKVELFFEGMRPFDLKRWKMGEVFGQDLLGVNKRWIDQSRTRVQLNTLNWKTVNGESYLLIEEGRKFDPKKNYLFPIPFAQMQLNPNLKPQNPGWN